MMLHGSWQVSVLSAADSQDWYDQNLGVFRFPEDAEAKANGVPQNVEVGTAIGNGFSFNCWKEDGSVDADKAGRLLCACYPVLSMMKPTTMIRLTNGSDHSVYQGIMKTTIDDPNMKVVADVFFTASNVQLWYDQYLPASVTEVHKDCMTELFGLAQDTSADRPGAGRRYAGGH